MFLQFCHDHGVSGTVAVFIRNTDNYIAAML
jgi:hypothetical protein